MTADVAMLANLTLSAMINTSPPGRLAMKSVWRKHKITILNLCSRAVGLRILLTCFLAWVILITPFKSSLAQPPQAFLRYDDFSHSSNIDIERKLFDAAEKLGIGIMVGVIPFPDLSYSTIDPNKGVPPPRLTDEKLSLLREKLEHGVIEVAVHGFSHTNNSHTDIQSEFAGLPQNIQTRLLAAAKQSLETALGHQVRIFVPPFNQYDDATIEALDKNGYKMLSAGMVASPRIEKHGLAYIPGGPYPHKFVNTASMAAMQNMQDTLITIVIHPYDLIEDGANLPEFRQGRGQISLKELVRDLEQLRDSGLIEVISASSFMKSGDKFTFARNLANQRLVDSLITRHRLLPESLHLFPVEGAYYSEDSAKDLLNRQIGYAILVFTVIAMTTFVIATAFLRIALPRREIFIKWPAQSIAVALLLAMLATLQHAYSGGFYFRSAVVIDICFAALAALLFHYLKTQKKQPIFS